MKVLFERTCTACPEQYDVYNEAGEGIGYVRLRWGKLYAEYPCIDGEVIYEQNYEDKYKGSFGSEEERKNTLQQIGEAYVRKIVGNEYTEIEVI